MIDKDELMYLRRRWRTLAHGFDRRAALRYRLVPQGWREILLDRFADVQALFGFKRGFVAQGGWPAVLKHAECPGSDVVVLIWALGRSCETIRLACEGFARLAAKPSKFCPVLLTDVADFAYYTRLGWLIEYLPTWDGPGASYREQKLAYLAWRYRHAVVVPVSAGSASEEEWTAMMGADLRR